MWSAVLYGIGAGDGEIVTVALSQIGNVGGQPYWSWYGFNSRVEWCACFVSWCANECGYIDAGVIPKFAGCIQGSNWFKERGLWQDGSFTPSAGHIIFFDWEGDGETDHVGIVERVENGTVYTVEGNSGDACKLFSLVGAEIVLIRHFPGGLMADRDIQISPCYGSLGFHNVEGLVISSSYHSSSCISCMAR